MKTVLLIVVGVILASSSMVAAPACIGDTTVAALVALGSGGCDVIFASDTKRFNNFVATGSGVGANATLDFISGAGEAGYTFSGATGSFAGAFTLGYTVSIVGCAANFTCSISGRVEQSLFSSGATGSIGLDGGLAALTLANQTDIVTGLNVQTLTKLATYNGLGTLINYSSDALQSVTPNQSTPEPVTLSMVGAGLLALGFLGRRARK